MAIGAHVSTAGGLSTCVGRAQALGIECMQIFLSAPQRWQEPRHSDEQVQEYGRLVANSGIGPNFAHATYLINLASEDPALRQRSIQNLSAGAAWADRVGLAGVVVHVGSGRGQPIEEAERQVASALERVLAETAKTQTPVVLENSAGSGETLGSRMQQIGSLLERLGRDARLGLCIDTAHTFASGYDLRMQHGIEQVVDEVDRFIGLERLKVIHANDSQADLGSAVDRHADIGRGRLGEEAFGRMLAHPRLADLPWVLEVPGADKTGPDAANVRALKRLAGRAVD
jgi:deoxyribonuclease-4